MIPRATDALPGSSARKRAQTSVGDHQRIAITEVPEPQAGSIARQLADLLDRRIAAADATLQSAGLLTWAARYLPGHFALEPSLMHRWMDEQCGRMQQCRGTKLNLIGPRGSAKSTVGTLAWPLRLALEGIEPYIWIVSDTKPQACAHLENIKAELRDNALLAQDYAHALARPPLCRMNFIGLANGAVIEAYGTGQRVRGRRWRQHRPSLIICDDLQNDQHMISATLRERSRNWFHGTLLRAGAPRTNVANLATALHRDALAMELARTPGWVTRSFRAIERWPDNMLLWQQWEAIYCDLERPDSADGARQFYEVHRPEMQRGAVLLWPEREDLYALMCMRVESGRSAFEREKQSSPIAPELCEWPAAYFESLVWFDQWPARPRVKTMALDPSKGQDARGGDYSALVMLAVDEHGTLYVEADLARRPTAQIVADAAERYRQFVPDAFGIESNQFQELLAGAMTAEFERQGLLGVRPWAINNHVNKLVRIRRLGPYLAAGRVRFRAASPATALLIEQLRDFPLGDHDDGPDALEMAVRLAAEMMASPVAGDGLGNRLPLHGR
ncbi:MAG TPA: phage terminase large subunit [Pirellulales bacterium]